MTSDHSAESDLHDAWEDIESRLQGLLAVVANLATDEPFAEAREYLEHGEYGLSLDAIAGTLASHGIRVAPTLYSTFVELGRAMEMEDDFWDPIRPSSDS